MKKLALILVWISILFHSCKKEDGHQPYLIDNPSETTQLLLEISGFDNLDGNLAISISKNSEQFDSETLSYIDTVIGVVSSNMSIAIDGITGGTYAVSAFHDENQDNVLNVGLFGIPQEGFGFSNNPNIAFSKPEFNDCKFVIEDNQNIAVPITLVYF